MHYLERSSRTGAGGEGPSVNRARGAREGKGLRYDGAAGRRSGEVGARGEEAVAGGRVAVEPAERVVDADDLADRDAGLAEGAAEGVLRHGPRGREPDGEHHGAGLLQGIGHRGEVLVRHRPEEHVEGPADPAPR